MKKIKHMQIIYISVSIILFLISGCDNSYKVKTKVETVVYQDVDLSSTVIKRLPAGYTIKILKVGVDKAKIEYRGEEGWIQASNLDIEELQPEKNIKNYKGKVYVILHKDIEHLGGGMLGSIADLQKEIGNFSYSNVKVNNQKIIFLEESIGIISSVDRAPKSLIHDVLLLPALKNDELFEDCKTSCGSPDNHLFAIVKKDYSSPYYKNIVKAWYLDLKEKKIKPCLNKKIKCICDGCG